MMLVSGGLGKQMDPGAFVDLRFFQWLMNGKSTQSQRMHVLAPSPAQAAWETELCLDTLSAG